MEKLSETRKEARLRFDTALDAADAKVTCRKFGDSVPMPKGPGSPAPGFAIFSRNVKAYDRAKGDFGASADLACADL